MRAVLYREFGGPVGVESVADPAPPPGGVVVRVLATGLCRSDWHGWMGHDPDIGLPHVPGHEFAGTIAAVGAGVTGWQAGDRVTAPFVCACGHCAACAAGDQQVCEQQAQPGFTYWGSFADYVVVPAAAVNLIRLDGELSYAAAAALGCRFATAYRAVADQGRVRPGEWVAVHGCGGVGLSAVMIAAAAGARVVAVDVTEAALNLAQRCGAEIGVQVLPEAGSAAAGTPATPEQAAAAGLAPAPGRAAETGLAGAPGLAAGTGLAGAPGLAAEARMAKGANRLAVPAAAVAETVVGLTGGGAQLSLDALGSEATCANSILSLRRRGRHVQVGLLPAALGRPRLPMDKVIAAELEILGSHGMAAHAYPRLLALIAAGTLDPGLLVTQTLGLDAAPQALASMDRQAQPGIRLIEPGRAGD
jgi:alcohol dehydrogenase